MKNSGYFLSQAIKNLFRNAFMSFAAIFTITGCLVILGIFTLFTFNANHLANQIKEQCEIQLFIDFEASQERIKEIENEILMLDNIKSVEFYSKENMLDFAVNDMFEGREYELSGFEEDNPFHDSYKITLSDISKTDTTVQELEKIENTDHVLNNQEIINNILSFSDVIKKSGIILMVLLFVLSMVIISNTVKLTVFNRRKEINIMKYIGAEDEFIKTPFIIEGAILGAVSSIVAFLLVAGAYVEIYHLFGSSEFNTLSLISYDNITLIISWLIFLFIGSFIGIAGSSFSVKQHLKV